MPASAVVPRRTIPLRAPALAALGLLLALVSSRPPATPPPPLPPGVSSASAWRERMRAEALLEGETAGSGYGVEESGGARTSGALQALAHWTESRAWPEARIPEAAFADAWDAIRAAPQSPAGAGAPPWRPLGPTNIGGRTLSVALNPQNPLTVYAGSAGGGLWRSRSGGVGVSAWERITTGFPVTSVSTVAIAPADSQLILIGTGEVYAYQAVEGGQAVRTARGTYGIGILRSEDGGATWQKTLDWARQQSRGVWMIKFDPALAGRVWAATTEGVYRSDDGGQSWTLSLTTIMATDVEVDPTNGNTVYAACGNFGSTGHGIYRTQNAGANWSKLSGGLPGSFGGKAELAIAPSQPQRIYASIGNGSVDFAGTWLMRSDNGGDTWITASTEDYSTYQGWFAHDVAVAPNDPARVFAVGIDIWRSVISGASLVRKSDWSDWYFGDVPPGGPEGGPEYSHADHHMVVFHPTNPAILYFATDGGIFRSLDGGETYEGCNGGYQTGQFYNGFSSAASDTIPAMGGLQDNSTVIYKGTPGWTRVIGGDGSWTAISPASSLALFGSYQYLNVLRSLDGGANFTQLSIPAGGGTPAFIAPFVISTLAPTTLFAARSTVYRSLDSGTSWTARGNVNSRSVISMALSAQNTNILYVGTIPNASGRSVYRSANGGTSWTDVSAALPNRYPTDLAVDPVDDRRVFVTFAGYGSGHLYRTLDSGLNWTDVSTTLPDLPAGAVAIDPVNRDTIYLANDLGVFVSFDGGGSWGGVSEGLPEAVFGMDLSIQPSARRLRLATHGNGVYERPLFESPVGVPETGALDRGLRLLAAAPNPFVRATTLALALTEPVDAADAVVLDLQGRVVRTLLRAVPLSAGRHELVWDGRDDGGSDVAAGVYFVRVTAGAVSARQRVVRVR